MGEVSRTSGRADRRGRSRDRARRTWREGVIAAPKSASLLAGCALARPAAAGCAWCGAALPPRRRTWCSERCSDAFWDNHWWSRARVAAKRRDKYRCARCGHKPPPRPSRVRHTTEASYRSAMRTWRAARAANRVEVNHREPALGAHATLSCIHHLDNLETLCVGCHKIFTAGTRPVRRSREVALPG